MQRVEKWTLPDQMDTASDEDLPNSAYILYASIPDWLDFSLSYQTDYSK